MKIIINKFTPEEINDSIKIEVEKLMLVYKTHKFNIIYKASQSSADYYMCETCGYKRYAYDFGNKDLITCDEQIIKNIIE